MQSWDGSFQAVFWLLFKPQFIYNFESQIHYQCKFCIWIAVNLHISCSHLYMYASPISYFGENPQIQIRENSTCNFSSEITWISCLPCLYINFDGWYFFLFSQFFLKDRSKPCVSGHFTCNFCHGDFAQLTSSLPINCPWRGWGVQGCLFVIF